MTDLTLQFSDDVLSALRCSPEEFAHKLRVAAAIHWYEHGELSQEKAAHVAGLTRAQFLMELARTTTNAFVVDFESLKRELSLAESPDKRARPEHVREPDCPYDGAFEPPEDDALWFDSDPTQSEIEDEDRIRVRRREAFRRAADYVSAAFARLTFVQRVVLFGSVAQPPRRETPRQRRYRRAGARLWRESKDVDLAVWVSDVSDLRALQKARGRAVNDLLADLGLGVAHHQVDVFLLEPRTNRYLGRLCHYGTCPKGKLECRVAGCGAALFLRQHEGFVFDPRSLEKGGVVLFDRAKGLSQAE